MKKYYLRRHILIIVITLKNTHKKIADTKQHTIQPQGLITHQSVPAWLNIIFLSHFSVNILGKKVATHVFVTPGKLK